MANLNGKVGIVTGASKGIGAAVAEALAKQGAAVVVNYANTARQAEEVVARINAGGGKAKAVRADISNPAESKKLVDNTLAEYKRVDILVNNAGVYDFVPLGGVTEQYFDRIFHLNVRGLLFATQAAVNAFDDLGGAVINVSSLASLLAVPNGSVYGAAKAAVDAITRNLAAELGPRKIRVNSVLPGPVETEGTQAMAGFDQFSAQLVSRTPLGRLGQPRDIANVVSFLASDEAGWITGQLIPVAGGLS